MHSPRLQRYWFAALWLLFPWPLLVLQDAFVPAARYVLLGGVAAIVAFAEGAAGPVGEDPPGAEGRRGEHDGADDAR